MGPGRRRRSSREVSRSASWPPATTWSARSGSWIAPTLASSAWPASRTWPRDGAGRCATAGGGLGAATVLAGATATAALAWAAGQNEQAYGTSVLADLADGEIARAYGEWQRVEAGTGRRYVPVDAEQRRAVFEVSPAAAEMQPALDDAVIAWLSLGCDTFEMCDDYMGAYFVWAMRERGLGQRARGLGRRVAALFRPGGGRHRRGRATQASSGAPRAHRPAAPLRRLDGERRPVVSSTT